MKPFQLINTLGLKYFSPVPKRIRIFASTLTMTFLLLLSTFFQFSDWWWLWVPVFLFTAYFLTFFSVLEGVDGIEWLMLFLMPVIFTISIYFFYSIFPVRWLTRLPLMGLYAFGFYALLLTSNIFNVGVEKSIQLYRAAFSVNYLFQTFMVFLLMLVLFFFKQSFLVNGLIASILTIPFITQLSWTVNPNAAYDKDLLKYTWVVGIVTFEVAVLVSFIPLKSSIGALLMTAIYYSLTGLIYHFLDHKLYQQVVREYVFVLLFVVAIAFLTLRW